MRERESQDLMRHRGSLRELGWTLLGLLLLAATLHPLLATGQETKEAVAPIEIVADSLVVEDTKHAARFSGGVVVRSGDWTMRCASLRARYDEGGEIVDAVAEGPVVLTWPEGRVDAARAKYEHQARRITLEGEPTLRRGQSRLSGEQIVVEIESRRVEVKRARGRFVPSKER